MYKKLQIKVLGNLLLDEGLDHNLISEEDFEHEELKDVFRKIVLERTDETQKGIVFLTCRDDLISACTDAGIVTADYKHNCRQIKKYSVKKQLVEIGKQIELSETHEIESVLRYAKTVISGLETELEHKGMKVVDCSDCLESLDTSEIKYIPTGFSRLDEVLNMLETKRVTLVTGKSHSGKTVVVRNFIAKAVDSGNKCLWIMGENERNDEVRRLARVVLGNNDKYYTVKRENIKYVKLPTQESIIALSKWSSGKLKIIHKADSKLKDHKEMFELMESELKENKHELIVIDNLMSMLSAKSFEKNEAQADFMQRCCDIAKIYNTHIVLVLHPRKGGDMKKGDYDDISGSSDIPNKADNILFVGRTEDTESEYDGFIKVSKNKKWGELDTINLIFDKSTSNYLCVEDGRAKESNYNIEKYFDKTIKFQNGKTQTFENNELG